MAKLKQSYETVMIFSVKDGEDKVKELVKKFTDLITENATVDNIEEWGKRRLAYTINDEADGYYVLVNFTCTPDFPAELDRVYKITDGVLRTMIIANEE